jgi:hypothetical protein
VFDSEIYPSFILGCNIKHWYVEHVYLLLEAVALELLVYFLVQAGLNNIRLLIHSDNNGAIGAHEKGHSPNIEINLCVRRTYTVIAEQLIVPEFVYIESALNPSDPISRGEQGPSSFKHLKCSFEVPDELIDAIIDVHV